MLDYTGRTRCCSTTILFTSRPEKKVVLSIATAASLATISLVHWRDHRTHVTRCLFLLATLSIYCFRAANGAVLLPGIYEFTSLSKSVFFATSIDDKVLQFLFVLLSHLVSSLTFFGYKVKGDFVKITTF